MNKQILYKIAREHGYPKNKYRKATLKSLNEFIDDRLFEITLKELDNIKLDNRAEKLNDKNPINPTNKQVRKTGQFKFT